MVGGYVGSRKPAVYGHPAYRYAGQKLDRVRLAKELYECYANVGLICFRFLRPKSYSVRG